MVDVSAGTYHRLSHGYVAGNGSRIGILLVWVFIGDGVFKQGLASGMFKARIRYILISYNNTLSVEVMRVILQPQVSTVTRSCVRITGIDLW